jgi:hypothetical protein
MTLYKHILGNFGKQILCHMSLNYRPIFLEWSNVTVSGSAPVIFGGGVYPTFTLKMLNNWKSD